MYARGPRSPDALRLWRNGTHGAILCSKSWCKPSMTIQRVPDWARIRELRRTNITPRIQSWGNNRSCSSGVRTLSFSNLGTMPAWQWASSALCKNAVCLVRVVAAIFGSRDKWADINHIGVERDWPLPPKPVVIPYWLCSPAASLATTATASAITSRFSVDESSRGWWVQLEEERCFTTITSR